MGWTKCGCGHIAQDHNRAHDEDRKVVERGPVSGNEPGRWTQADVDSVKTYGCDRCECENYDGHLVGR